jgi:pteridine reductase
VLDEKRQLAHHPLVTDTPRPQDDDTQPLAGKVALVTGGARRVGRAIASELAAAGAKVAIHYNTSKADATALVEELEAAGRTAQAFQADLGDGAECARLIDEVLAWDWRLDVLVNNAAVFKRLPFTGGDDATWESAWADAIDVNLLGPARLARRAAAPLATTRGVIVNILDIAALQAWPTYTHYGASKAGLAWLTRTLAVALAPEVRVVGVAPGIAEFPEALDAAARERLVDKVPLKRPGSGADIAQAVRYLVTADYVTGAVIAVDGGRLVATGDETA